MKVLATLNPRYEKAINEVILYITFFGFLVYIKVAHIFQKESDAVNVTMLETAICKTGQWGAGAIDVKQVTKLHFCSHLWADLKIRMPSQKVALLTVDRLHAVTEVLKEHGISYSDIEIIVTDNIHCEPTSMYGLYSIGDIVIHRVSQSLGSIVNMFLSYYLSTGFELLSSMRIMVRHFENKASTIVSI